MLGSSNDMHLLLLIVLHFAIFFYITGAVPRWSWGSFANFDRSNANNGTIQRCPSGRCVQTRYCPEYLKAVNSSEICSNLSGGPWTCCVDIDDVNLGHSKPTKSQTNEESTKQFIFELISNHSQTPNSPTTNATPPISYSSTESVKEISELNSRTISSPFGLEPKADLVYRARPMHTHIQNVPRKPSSTENISNPTVNVSLDKDPDLSTSGKFPEDRSDTHALSETRNRPISERGNEHHPYTERDWTEVTVDFNNNDHIANYYRKRSTAQGYKTTPGSKPTNGYRHRNRNLNSDRKETKHGEGKTTPHHWRKPTKGSWDSGYTSPHRKSTKASEDRMTSRPWRKPASESWNRDHTSNHNRKSTKVIKDVTTRRSWEKPTKRNWARGSTPNSEDKYTKSREILTTPRPRKSKAWNKDYSAPSWSISTGMWSGRRRSSISTQKSASTAAATKVMLKSTTPYPRRDSIDTRSTKNIPSTTRSNNLSTKRSRTESNDNAGLGRSTSKIPKRTTISRSSTTKSAVNNRHTTTKKYTTTTPMPDLNTHTCGLRDSNSIASTRGESGRTFENNPDAIVYTDSREGVRSRAPFQRIVGGEEAEPYSWPWVAALYKVTSTGGNRFLCAGTLINENFVLTAAHVFTREDLRSATFIVMLGTHTAKEAVAEYSVMSVLPHPNYQQRFYYNDIALLKLDHPVVFNSYVMPVCLPSPKMPLISDSDLVGKRVTVMGWGDKSYGGITSRVLREVSFPIVSRQTCNASYIQVASNRFPNGITANMLCAGAPDGGKDACQGDSGGPLTTIENGRYTQVGIVSFGYKCGDKEYPGVYTKVASYLGWIKDNAHCGHTSYDYYDYHGR